MECPSTEGPAPPPPPPKRSSNGRKHSIIPGRPPSPDHQTALACPTLIHFFWEWFTVSGPRMVGVVLRVGFAVILWRQAVAAPDDPAPPHPVLLRPPCRERSEDHGRQRSHGAMPFSPAYPDGPPFYLRPGANRICILRLRFSIRPESAVSSHKPESRRPNGDRPAEHSRTWCVLRLTL